MNSLVFRRETQDGFIPGIWGPFGGKQEGGSRLQEGGPWMWRWCHQPTETAAYIAANTGHPDTLYLEHRAIILKIQKNVFSKLLYPFTWRYPYNYISLPINEAAYKGNTECVKILLDHNAEVDKLDVCA